MAHTGSRFTRGVFAWPLAIVISRTVSFEEAYLRSLVRPCFLFAALCLSMPHTAIACSFNQSGPMPVCTLAAPTPDECVIIIEADSRVPTNLRFGTEGKTARLVDVEIAKDSDPLYIVLAHYQPTIFRFSGYVERISRIAALGSAYLGTEIFGVIGVDDKKIIRVPITGVDDTRITSCSAPPKACLADQFFAYSGNAEQAAERAGNWPAFRGRWTPNNVISVNRLTPNAAIVIRKDLPENLDSPERKWVPGNPQAIKAYAKRWATLSNIEKYHEDASSEVKLDRSTVYSPTQLISDELAISWDGIAQLEAQGLIVGPNSSKFREIYEPWHQRLALTQKDTTNTPYDDDTPVIDFVLTDQIRIPRELAPLSPHETIGLLVADSVASPIFEKYQVLGPYCIYFADNRESPQHANKYCDTLGKLRRRQHYLDAAGAE